MQGFGFENGRRVINRSPWVGQGSCRRVKNQASPYLNLQIICTGNMYKVIDVFWLLFL